MKILVVDDEQLARERLLRLLGKLRPGAECLEASDGITALQMARQHGPELILLDIQMPGSNGIEVAAALAELEAPPAIIFCTAYDEYALEAFQHQAVAYLLKPVREADLEKALLTAGKINRMQLAELSGREESDVELISSQTHRGVESLPLKDIRCFIAEHKYVTAHTPRSELIVQQSLRELEDTYGDRFLRVHRNTLVAVSHIQKLERDEDGSWRVVLEGMHERPIVSRRHLSQAKARVARPQ
ncbi:response regulator transcription factor [Halioglobus maricola]|uniref:Response regulator transcription factor n=1 Tax=Halioglobus maricola TaxID=2601894 RepID=A0A5P9NM96_9GAMM|nr:LytTR family DNA-binding domain-containing protein [Halioglobus maricola]QFU76993.1 response regulator transcription factor [Halioglobus maricola]